MALTHLEELEAEAIYIIREVMAINAHGGIAVTD